MGAAGADLLPHTASVCLCILPASGERYIVNGVRSHAKQRTGGRISESVPD